MYDLFSLDFLHRVAQTCSDIKVKHRIDTTCKVNWYRCRSVVFEGGTATWELNQTARYDLLKAYDRQPHRQLIEASEDNSLRAFVKAWGPLTYSLTAWNGSDPISAYRRQRDTLRAWVLLISAIQKSENLHESALGLLRMDAEPYAIWIRHRLGLPHDLQSGFDDEVEKRLASASKSEIEDVCGYLVGSFPLPSAPAFVIGRIGHGFSLRASLGENSLMTALYWMVWQDVFMENPFEFCKECHRLIPQETKHTRKFCSTECARRRTGREWLQRKRERERKAYGTQKTR